MKILIKIILLTGLAISNSGLISCQHLPKKGEPKENVRPVFTEGELEMADTPEPRSVTERLKLLTNLPLKVNECSGLEMINGAIWTLNDSGSPSEIYKVNDKKSQLIHQISINPAVNTDWEELAANEEFLYIGNFGNNYGRRENLMVYSVSLSDVNEETSTAKPTSTYEFEFANQTEFSHANNKHNFDCEAMIAMENRLYLFSKNREDNQCTIYSLNLEQSEEKQKLQPVSTFDTKGQVTAADYSEESGVLALLGYVYQPSDGSMHPFLYLFYDFSDNNFFGGRNKRFDLGLKEQTEGLSFKDANTLYIASEAESGGQGKLFEFDISGLIQ